MPAHKRRPDGRLKAAVKIGVKPDGTPRYKYVFGTSERELQRKIEEVRLSVKTGTLHTSDKITVEQLLQIWMERHIAKKEPNTQEFYRHRVRDIVAVIGAVKVKDLSPLHVEGAGLLCRQTGALFYIRVVTPNRAITVQQKAMVLRFRSS